MTELQVFYSFPFSFLFPFSLSSVVILMFSFLFVLIGDLLLGETSCTSKVMEEATEVLAPTLEAMVLEREMGSSILVECRDCRGGGGAFRPYFGSYGQLERGGSLNSSFEIVSLQQAFQVMRTRGPLQSSLLFQF